MDGFDQLSERVHCWFDVASWTGRPDRTYRRNGFILDLGIAGVVALVDPPALTPSQETALVEGFGLPTHILLTCEEHVRESVALRGRFGSRLLINGLAEVEHPVDDRFRDGERLWDVVEVHHVPDVYWPEETVFVVDGEQRVMIIGDALCGGREDIGVADGEIGIFSTRYITNRARARATLQRLATVECDLVCFGHGSPVRDPVRAFEEFLGRVDL